MSTPQPPEPQPKGPDFTGWIVALAVVAVVVIAWFVVRAIWIDTHCTMILGTRVCQ